MNDLKTAIEELKKQRKRNFNQSIELIINLKNFDARKDSVNTFVEIPYPPLEKKICAFLDKPSSIFDFSIAKPDFDKWNDKKEIKKLGREFDFFVSIPQLMQPVAARFGRILGPLNKMPSPQLGLLTANDEKGMKEIIAKMRKTVRIKAKEPSLKIMVGKEDNETEKIAANIETIYNAAVNALPKKKENIKSVMIKSTMGHPIRIEMK